jgi:hypothetical protein
MDLVNVAPGQCRLQVDSPTQLSLQRYAGAYIPQKIGGVWEAKLIPSSGPTLANTGLTEATLYYVYSYDDSGTLTLEASTTGHSADADTGVQIKTGDASRTLVGKVYMAAGTPGTFVNSTAKRLCLNWFNRAALDLHGTYSADRNTGSTTFAELNTEIRVEFLTWDDEAVDAGAAGTVSNTSGSQASHMGLAFDSTTVPIADVGHTISNGNQRQAWSLWVSTRLAAGFHFLTLLGAVSGGSMDLVTATNVGIGTAKTHLWASIRG